MKSKETTKLLGKILYNQKFSGIGKYYANEVSLNYGTKDVCRVDFMQFVPPSQMSISCYEKGIFICYEVKSCLDDFKSGHGQNYIGEENYLVMPMELYKKVINEIPRDVGVLVPVPKSMGRINSEIHEEFENPRKFEGNANNWKLYKIRNHYPKNREKSTTELLFCMSRNGGAWVAINVALKREDLVNKVIADSFDGGRFAHDFAEKLLKERKNAKLVTNARQFCEWCQGGDWETIVDLDTEI